MAEDGDQSETLHADKGTAKGVGAATAGGAGCGFAAFGVVGLFVVIILVLLVAGSFRGCDEQEPVTPTPGPAYYSPAPPPGLPPSPSAA